MTILAANDAWAVGHVNDQTLTIHWNGTAWSIIPSPNPGISFNNLAAVAAIAPNDVWAVGGMIPPRSWSIP